MLDGEVGKKNREIQLLKEENEALMKKIKELGQYQQQLGRQREGAEK